MASDSRFLGLPRELRDRIYSYYVFESNGYCHNPNTGKLRVGGEPGHCIDHALQYTCTSIAAELRGVDLRENTIHFRASQDDGTKAYRFESLLRARRVSFNLMLNHATDLIAPDVLDTLRVKYPDNDTPMELIKDPDRGKIAHIPTTPLDPYFTGYHPWIGPTTGETPSLNRAIVQDMLQLALSKPSPNPKDTAVLFTERFIRHWEERFLRAWGISHIFPFYQDTYREMLQWRPPMWKIPTATDLNHAKHYYGAISRMKGGVVVSAGFGPLAHQQSNFLEPWIQNYDRSCDTLSFMRIATALPTLKLMLRA